MVDRTVLFSIHATKTEKCITYSERKADTAYEVSADVTLINDSSDGGEFPQDPPNPGAETEEIADEQDQKGAPNENFSVEDDNNNRSDDNNERLDDNNERSK